MEEYPIAYRQKILKKKNIKTVISDYQEWDMSLYVFWKAYELYI